VELATHLTEGKQVLDRLCFGLCGSPLTNSEVTFKLFAVIDTELETTDSVLVDSVSDLSVET
jgi:hypothetical protein